MLCYYGRFKVKDYNKDIVVNTFIEWMQTTKNRMEGFNYNHSDNYNYRLEDKEVKVNDFSKQEIFGIQFKRVENRRNNQFTVEVLYDYKNEILNLLFYKEIADNSKTIHSITLPKLFEMYLREVKDHYFTISNKPIFMSLNKLSTIKRYYLPVVVLYRKEGKCKRNFNQLAKDLFGIAHVVVCNVEDDQLLNTMRVYYSSRNYDDYSIHENSIVDELRNRLVEINSQEYTYIELETLAYEENYQSKKDEHDEIMQSIKEELDDQQIEIDMYLDDNKILEAKIKQLEEENNRLEQISNKNKKRGLIYLPVNDTKVKDYIYERIEAAIQSLNVDNKNKIFRRKDILESIMEAKDED